MRGSDTESQGHPSPAERRPPVRLVIACCVLVVASSVCSTESDERAEPAAADPDTTGDGGAPAPDPDPVPPGPTEPPNISVGAETTEETIGASSAIPPATAAQPDGGQPATAPDASPPAPNQADPPGGEDEPPSEGRQRPRTQPGTPPVPRPGGVLGGLITAGEITALEEAVRLQRARCEALSRDPGAREQLRACRARLSQLNRRLRQARARQ